VRLGPASLARQPDRPHLDGRCRRAPVLADEVAGGGPLVGAIEARIASAAGERTGPGGPVVGTVSAEAEGGRLHRGSGCRHSSDDCERGEGGAGITVVMDAPVAAAGERDIDSMLVSKSVQMRVYCQGNNIPASWWLLWRSGIEWLCRMRKSQIAESV
jgi:hypothetical protein